MPKVPLNRMINGDCLEVMLRWPDGCVDTCVTSPPYWGLRKYGDHRLQICWGSWDAFARPKGHKLKRWKLRLKDRAARKGFVRSRDGRTLICGYGLEPTPEEYIEHTVEIFREVRRVLSDTGTCWINLGGKHVNKQLLGLPWRVALALQADGAADWKAVQSLERVMDAIRDEYEGDTPPARVMNVLDRLNEQWRQAKGDSWYLRSDIIWHKPNPMPESCTDRPTKAHEYLFLLSKRPEYYYDGDAIREEPISKGLPSAEEMRGVGFHDHSADLAEGQRFDGKSTNRKAVPAAGRNKRTVWTIPTQACSEAHFATFPEKLVEPCILAGCPREVCTECGKPRERIVEKTRVATRPGNNSKIYVDPEGSPYEQHSGSIVGNRDPQRHCSESTTTGWTDCGCGKPFRPGIVCDIFGGSGTVGIVAARLKRDYVLIELSPEYAQDIARPRLQAVETGVPLREARNGQRALFEMKNAQ